VESVLDIGGDGKIFGKVRRREVVAEQTLKKFKAKLAQKNQVLAELLQEQSHQKKPMGTLKATRPHTRHPDQIVNHVNRRTERTKITAQQLVDWARILVPIFTGWRKKYGRTHEH
jgi:hypothetical protein